MDKTKVWLELQPGKVGEERVTVSQMRGGGLMVSMSAVVAKRNKIGKDTRLRIMAGLEQSPRVVRLVVDPNGPFRPRIAKGEAAVVVIGKLPGLGHIRFEKTACEFDEMNDEQKRLVIEVELPKALQVPDRPIVPSVHNGAKPDARR